MAASQYQASLQPAFRRIRILEYVGDEEWVRLTTEADHRFVNGKRLVAEGRAAFTPSPDDPCGERPGFPRRVIHEHLLAIEKGHVVDLNQPINATTDPHLASFATRGDAWKPTPRTGEGETPNVERGPDYPGSGSLRGAVVGSAMPRTATGAQTTMGGKRIHGYVYNIGKAFDHFVCEGETYLLVPLGADRCLPNVRRDEPIFVLRAQDISSVQTLMHWYQANRTKSPAQKLLQTHLDIKRFMDWQMEHKQFVKVPD